jgi:hypothetical protein
MKVARALALTPAAIIRLAYVWRPSWKPMGVLQLTEAQTCVHRRRPDSAIFNRQDADEFCRFVGAGNAISDALDGREGHTLGWVDLHHVSHQRSTVNRSDGHDGVVNRARVPVQGNAIHKFLHVASPDIDKLHRPNDG